MEYKNLVISKYNEEQQTPHGIQKFGIINAVDNVNWPLYRDSESWRFER